MSRFFWRTFRLAAAILGALSGLLWMLGLAAVMMFGIFCAMARVLYGLPAVIWEQSKREHKG